MHVCVVWANAPSLMLPLSTPLAVCFGALLLQRHDTEGVGISGFARVSLGRRTREPLGPGSGGAPPGAAPTPLLRSFERGSGAPSSL